MKLLKNNTTLLAKLFLWMLIGVVALGQFQRIELGQIVTYSWASNVNLYIHELLMFMLSFHVLFTDHITIIKRVKSFFITRKIFRYFMSWFLITFIIGFFSQFDITMLFYLARLSLYVLFFFTLQQFIKKYKINREYLKFQFFSLGLVTLFLGIVQYILIPDTRILAILGWDDHFARLIGTFFDPGYTGFILLATGTLGLSSTYIKQKSMQILTVFAFSIGIIATFSRATYLAALGAAFYVLLQKYTSLKYIIGSFLGILFLFTLTIALVPKRYGEGVNLFRTASITARFDTATTQLKQIETRTLLIGSGVFSEQIPTENQLLPSHSRIPDNIFVTVILGTGVIGLILFCMSYLKIIHTTRKKDVYIAGLFVALILHAQFNNTLLYPFTLFVLAGSIASLRK